MHIWIPSGVIRITDGAFHGRMTDNIVATLLPPPLPWITWKMDRICETYLLTHDCLAVLDPWDKDPLECLAK